MHKTIVGGMSLIKAPNTYEWVAASFVGGRSLFCSERLPPPYMPSTHRQVEASSAGGRSLYCREMFLPPMGGWIEWVART